MTSTDRAENKIIIWARESGGTWHYVTAYDNKREADAELKRLRHLNKVNEFKLTGHSPVGRRRG